MWITWKNEAPDVSGTITAANELAVEFDLRLYGIGLDTGYNPDDPSKTMHAGNTYDMKYYLLFANPYLTTSTNSRGGEPASVSALTYDAVVGHVQIVTASNVLDTAVFTWKAADGSLADSYCTAEDLANCTNDTNNLWTTTTSGATE